ncbi:MAG: glycosyltransferase [Cyanobacteriota bacterium]|nr:glycosyltransferase [Cyanobacteriota bacterium]
MAKNALERISYVVPTLNSAATLDLTLLSLKSQKEVSIEIIVVDSGSTDGTLDICQRWNVPVLYAEPGNMYQAINLGLNQCQTEWLGYMNSDDWLYPDSTARLIAFGKESKADIVYGKCDYTDGCGRFLYSFAPAQSRQLLPLFKRGIFGFAQQAAIFRKSVYQHLNGFNEAEYYLSADAEFYLRALQSNFSFSRLSGPSVACFRRHQNQLTHQKARDIQLEKQKRREKAGQTTLKDWIMVTQWRLENVPHYLIRFLRPSLLADKIVLTHSANVGADSEV